MITTTEMLTSLGAYLAAQQLAQFDTDGHYLEDPGRPAVLFADADMPDTYVVIEVVGEDERIPDAVELALTFRGTTVAVVNGHADIIGTHFEQAFTPQWEHGTMVARLEIALPGGFEILDARRVKRGEMKLSAPKPNTNKGRYTRTDTYQFHFSRA